MADELKTVVSRISEGLNFFDFSFFISGAVTFFILWYVADDLNYKYLHCSSFGDYVIAVILIYVCGIVSFVSGRFLRTKFRLHRENDADSRKWWQVRSFDKIYEDTVNNMGTSPIESLPSNKSLAYSKMWIVIRQKDVTGKCYADLYRQWVMQAVCEGLFFSFLLLFFFSIALPIYECRNLDYDFNGIYFVSLIISAIGIAACLREAQRYAENQIKEVIITYQLLNTPDTNEPTPTH